MKRIRCKSRDGIAIYVLLPLRKDFVMLTEIKPRFLFYTLTVFLCLTCFFLMNTTAQVNNAPADAHATVQRIDIPSIAFLELTASSDFNYTFESIEVPGVDY
ncbi:hypothetical protein J5I95_13890, partial [Candidatus Poribacteria bacterium]|nr:hypothetical protein [Candidatus Poribacteria bacterium]